MSQLVVVKADEKWKENLPVSDKKRLDWADKILAAHRKTVEAILETGQLLIQAKDDLPHGGFELMVKNGLPFSVRTARMLMKIARHPVISNRQHIADLPPSWGTLYELSRLNKDELSLAIRKRLISPEMTRKGLEGLRRSMSRQVDYMKRKAEAPEVEVVDVGPNLREVGLNKWEKSARRKINQVIDRFPKKEQGRAEAFAQTYGEWRVGDAEEALENLFAWDKRLRVKVWEYVESSNEESVRFAQKIASGEPPSADRYLGAIRCAYLELKDIAKNRKKDDGIQRSVEAALENISKALSILEHQEALAIDYQRSIFECVE